MSLKSESQYCPVGVNKHTRDDVIDIVSNLLCTLHILKQQKNYVCLKLCTLKVNTIGKHPTKLLEKGIIDDTVRQS